jgi:hypothetical protein
LITTIFAKIKGYRKISQSFADGVERRRRDFFSLELRGRKLGG